MLLLKKLWRPNFNTPYAEAKLILLLHLINRTQIEFLVFAKSINSHSTYPRGPRWWISADIISFSQNFAIC